MCSHQTTEHQISEAKADKAERWIGKSTITAGDLNTSFSAIDKTIRQKISKDLELLKNNYQQARFDWQVLYSITVEYTLFSNTYGTFTKTNPNPES